jgi:hypothetical protein
MIAATFAFCTLTFASFAGLMIVVSLPANLYKFTKLYTSQLGQLADHNFLEIPGRTWKSGDVFDN